MVTSGMLKVTWLKVGCNKQGWDLETWCRSRDTSQNPLLWV